MNTFYKCENRPKGKGVSVTLSTSSFVPKPFTPFQWAPMNTKEEFLDKANKTRKGIMSQLDKAFEAGAIYNNGNLSIADSNFTKQAAEHKCGVLFIRDGYVNITNSIFNSTSSLVFPTSIASSSC